MSEIKKRVFQILIYNEGKVYEPIIKDKIKVTWSRGFQAGTLEFDVVKDKEINYQEGNTVTFSIDGETFFKGYVFSKSRKKEQVINTVCYDQLRYLKSKDTYQYQSQSMADLIKKICSDRGLKVGEIEDTTYKIPKRLEQNQEYLNMVKVANDITLSQTGKIFTLFDNAGEICLKSAENMIVDDAPLSYDNMVDFDYKTSIDDGTYNRVVVYLVDDNKSLIKKVVKEDKENIKKWGVLEYSVMTNNDEDIEKKASQILEVLNRKFRSLDIKQAIGNTKVRGGSVIPVQMMAIGDININSYMIVDKVQHTFYDDYHFMDLSVQNKDIQPIGSVDNIIKDKNNDSSADTRLNGARGAEGAFKGVAPNQKAKAMLDSSYSRLGYNYSQGKRGSGHYEDCSYHVWRSMKEAGFDVPGTPWNTASMVSSGNFVKIPFSEVQPGDVAIKPKTKGKNNGHTVIAVSKGEVIHSTPPKTKVSNMGKYASYGWYRPVMSGRG